MADPLDAGVAVIGMTALAFAVRELVKTRTSKDAVDVKDVKADHDSPCDNLKNLGIAVKDLWKDHVKTRDQVVTTAKDVAAIKATQEAQTKQLDKIETDTGKLVDVLIEQHTKHDG